MTLQLNGELKALHEGLPCRSFSVVGQKPDRFEYCLNYYTLQHEPWSDGNLRSEVQAWYEKDGVTVERPGGSGFQVGLGSSQLSYVAPLACQRQGSRLGTEAYPLITRIYMSNTKHIRLIHDSIITSFC